MQHSAFQHDAFQVQVEGGGAVQAPFAQYDWQTPKRVRLSAREHLETPAVAQTVPFGPKDWPSAKPRKPQTSLRTTLRDNFALQNTDTNTYLFRHPLLRPNTKRKPVATEQIDSGNALTTVVVEPNPFFETDYPKALPRKQPQQSDCYSSWYGLFVENPPIGEADFGLASRKVAINRTDHPVRGTIRLPQGDPFVQSTWPNAAPHLPSQRGDADRGTIRLPQDNPFLNRDFPRAAPRKPPIAAESKPGYIQQFPPPPEPVPPGERNWPTPVQARKSDRGSVDRGTIRLPQGDPFIQTDWPLAQRVNLLAHSSPPGPIAEEPVVIEYLPGAKLYHRIPKAKPPQNPGPVTNQLVLGITPAPKPFLQADWPAPVRVRQSRKDFELRSNIQIEPTPYSQYFWPLPTRVRDVRRNYEQAGAFRFPQGDPFRHEQIVIAKKLPKVAEESLNTLAILLPPPLKPATALYDWPLCARIPLKAQQYDETNLVPIIRCYQFPWLPIDDSQTPAWTPVDDSQTPAWGAVSDSQTPAWTPVSDSQTPSWIVIDDSQGPNWIDVHKC